MRSGDYVTLNGSTWTVAYVVEPIPACLGMEKRHVFMIRPKHDEDGYVADLEYALLPEDDVFMGWKAGPQFKLGQMIDVEIDYEDFRFPLVQSDDLALFLMRPDGSITSVWRWQASMLAHLGEPFAFAHADLNQAEEV